MSTGAFDRAVERLARQALAGFDVDVQRLREDASIARNRLAQVGPRGIPVEVRALASTCTTFGGSPIRCRRAECAEHG